MIFFDAPVAPDALTAFVRQVPNTASNALTALFPTRTYDDNEVEWAEITHTNRTARYRSWDGRIHVSERDTGSTAKVKLPPLSSSLNRGEYERLQIEFARTQGTFTEALERAIYNDAANLTGEIYNRMEEGWGDVLTDGKLSIDEDGFT
ncbi:MAG TPA: major capsid protein, partial [Ilumatobacteraceae bacterium]|nr:major capsid protein [Ilumatobacteraceae bacterium]